MPKSVEYYLSVGCDRKAAEYFASGRKKILAVQANADFTLTLDFEGGERRIYDCNPLLRTGTVFEPLMRSENFKRVYLDESGSVAWDIDPNVDSEKEWNNRVDICPDACYIESVPAAE